MFSRRSGPIEIQCLLGADIQMQLDECVALPATPGEMRTAVMRSLAWAERCKKAFARYRDEGVAGPGQALFGIVQGGTDAGLRKVSADGLVAMDFPATPSAVLPSASRRR